ncbi:D-alanyl-lipoteichoic acid biosynthesis protein DltB [Lacticaseibacillus zhaodongensis]|uniref:D-alanyl-lipoteichoic acid biosynthesis protein DltB n=1 Tax=Lacticaseibacillus zhaodongensis TaxID=2668065 RepID=UPI0012D32E9A|nr:D-alanyl-lipoteichoic acid biosynthesis protein DltB [Lacticaseibacillus zhaodongensis]
MPSMQPYTDPRYFCILLLALAPLVLGLLRGRRHRNYESIVSLVFIVLMFAGPKWQQGVSLIVYVAWQFGLICAYAHYRKHNNAGWVYYLTLFAVILPLAIVKITPAVAGGQPSLIGFLGISYLSFKAIGTLMEMRDGAIKELRPLLYLSFLLFMPTISSGPIDRYRHFAKSYDNAPSRDKYLDMLSHGVRYLFQGFLYKYIIGYYFGTILLPIVARRALLDRAAAGGTGISLALVAYMYVYSMYLFFDFAGYSLFAVSVSNFMGIDTPMNFNQPFRAKNIKDFWNRWHMSLSFWFRDYVFMRITFFTMKHRWFKKRVHISQFAYLCNFLIMGFWHGVTWYYITYGIFHACAIIINDIWLRFKKGKKLPSNRWTNALAIFVTFNVVCFSFLIFSGFLNKLWFTTAIR